MKRVGEVRSLAFGSLLNFLRRALRDTLVLAWNWIAGVQLFSLLALLSWQDVSLVIPATALSYVTGALAAKVLLGEHLRPSAVDRNCDGFDWGGAGIDGLTERVSCAGEQRTMAGPDRSRRTACLLCRGHCMCLGSFRAAEPEDF